MKVGVVITFDFDVVDVRIHHRMSLQQVSHSRNIQLLMIISTLRVDPSDPLFLFWSRDMRMIMCEKIS